MDLQADRALGVSKQTPGMKMHTKSDYMDLGATRRHLEQPQVSRKKGEARRQKKKGTRLYKCNICGQRGYWANECPMKKNRSQKEGSLVNRIAEAPVTLERLLLR